MMFNVCEDGDIYLNNKEIQEKGFLFFNYYKINEIK